MNTLLSIQIFLLVIFVGCAPAVVGAWIAKIRKGYDDEMQS